MLFTFRSEKVCDSGHVHVCTIVISKQVCKKKSIFNLMTKFTQNIKCILHYYIVRVNLYIYCI